MELYPSFSAEISSVLLEFLLKALNSSKSTELQNQSGQDFRVSLDKLKPAIMEFSNREPELLLNLLKAVLDMIQNNERRRYEAGNYWFFLGAFTHESQLKLQIVSRSLLTCMNCLLCF